MASNTSFVGLLMLLRGFQDNKLSGGTLGLRRCTFGKEKKLADKNPAFIVTYLWQRKHEQFLDLFTSRAERGNLKVSNSFFNEVSNYYVVVYQISTSTVN